MDAASVQSEPSVRHPKRAAAAAENTSSVASMDDDLAPKVKRRRQVNTRISGLYGYNLTDIIKSSGELIPHAVKQLVEKYDSNSSSMLADILMMLFGACGAKYHLNAASLYETKVDDVVVRLVDLAKNGKVEDNYNSKQKELKNFKENLASFWDCLILECQNGPLFDGTLFDKCMDYTIALSRTPPRIYRQVASLVGLQLVTSYIAVAKTLCGQRDTTQRQINAEQRRRVDVESLYETNKIVVIEKMMVKIYTELFEHRILDVDDDIRMACIKSLGIWILSYPSLFSDKKYLIYLGWALNDKSAAVRKTSVLALQNLYEVDDNVRLLMVFTKEFLRRMVELTNDIDTSVAKSAIGLLKQLLRHQLLTDVELSRLYGLLIDKPPMRRHAIDKVVYDYLITQYVESSSGPKGGDDESSKFHLRRLLQILRRFPDDPILSAYVIDASWEDMKATEYWKCIVSMLLDENLSIELSDVDATNLVRLLRAYARKAVGEKIVPATDNRKPCHTKAQKKAIENNRQEITTVMMKNYPQLLQKYATDKAKVSPLVDNILLLNLELSSLEGQEQNFKSTLELITDAFFKHGEKDTLRSCISALSFCLSESQADLRDYAQNKLKDIENELVTKLQLAMEEVTVGDDRYSLLVNLKRLYELQLKKNVISDDQYKNMARILRDVKDLDYEVVAFLFLNMYSNIAWGLSGLISAENSSDLDARGLKLFDKRSLLFRELECYADRLSDVQQKGRSDRLLSYRVCGIFSEVWCLFKSLKYKPTMLEWLGFAPERDILQKFWGLCEQLLHISEEDANEKYIEETNRDAAVAAAAQLIVSNTVPKDYLGPEIISHFVMHGANIEEIIKNLIADLKKSSPNEIPTLFVESLKRAYNRHILDLFGIDNEAARKSFSKFEDLATRLSGTFIGSDQETYRSGILKIFEDGIEFAFLDTPKRLYFLEGALLPFLSKLHASDALDILKDVKRRSENVITDEDPSGWEPYFTFYYQLRDMCKLRS